MSEQTKGAGKPAPMAAQPAGLWSKGAPLDAEMLRYTARDDASLDVNLLPFDIQASIAHVRGLGRIGALAEREAGITGEVVTRQLDAVLARSGVAALAKAVVAYEPVWAIGTGKTTSPQQAQEVHALIRARVTRDDAAVAGGLRILYGGSVKAANAAELFAMPDIDGGLIGGASLVAADFIAICAAAA